MKKSYQRKRLRRLAAILSAVLAMGTAGFSPVLYANPILDSKEAAVSIGGTATDMSINSTAPYNVIKWVDFSIGKNESVAFDAKNYLNCVTGSARSEIYGMLTGGGSIYLINPNGILIGDSAAINVGSLYLSTRNLSDDVLNEFSASGVNPLREGDIGGDVINLGKLNANSVTVEGNNITFKNVADVTKGGTLFGETITGGTVHNDSNVKLTANSDGEIHIGSDTGGELPAYTMSGTDKKYMYKLVSTAAELQAINNNPSGNYMLKNNITSGLENFTPIGNSTSFTGKFDGLGHTLSYLVINKENDSNIGLFGMAGSGSVIENLKLSGGSIKGGYYVGLVGRNFGTVRRVYNDGVSVKGKTQVGGIVGENQGMVTQVWNKGAVSGTRQVGGIVGLNSGGTVEVAYNAGSVNGIAGSYTIGHIGGIAGENINGSVKNIYNTGNVSAVNGSKVGGIVGYNAASVGNTATVSYAYNTGNVSVTNGSNVDGIVGENYATVNYTYDKPDNTTVFDGWTIDKDGTNSTAVWRQYGNNLPLLTAFLTRKDNITSTTEYNGGADVGAPSSGSSGGSGNFGSVTPTIPTVPTDIAPANSATSDHSASGTPSSGSATPTNLAAPADTASNANPASAPTANPTGSPAIANAIPAARGTAAEGIAIAALVETENIASSIAADTAAHRSVASVADVGHEGLSPSSAGSAPAGNPSGAAAPTGQLAGEAQNPQHFTWTAGGILAVADVAVNEPNAMSEASFAASQTARQETTPAPGRAMDGAAPTASGGTNAAAAGETTNPQSSDALMEQAEQTDLAIGTEESDTNNDNTAASTPANDAGEGTEDSDEKKKQR